MWSSYLFKVPGSNTGPWTCWASGCHHGAPLHSCPNHFQLQVRNWDMKLKAKSSEQLLGVTMKVRKHLGVWRGTCFRLPRYTVSLPWRTEQRWVNHIGVMFLYCPLKTQSPVGELKDKQTSCTEGKTGPKRTLGFSLAKAEPEWVESLHSSLGLFSQVGLVLFVLFCFSSSF